MADKLDGRGDWQMETDDGKVTVWHCSKTGDGWHEVDDYELPRVSCCGTTCTLRGVDVDVI